jgi:hypothetical protein
MIINEGYYQSYKNHELILDLNLNAFSIYDVSGWRDDQMPGLVDYLIFPEYSITTEQTDVTDNNGMVVVDAKGSIVTVNKDISVVSPFEPRHEIVTFLYLYQDNGDPFWGFSRYNNTVFRDWDGLVYVGWYGFSYLSYLVTGYNLMGDMARQGQSIYLQTYCRRTEQYYIDDGLGSATLDYPSACWVSSQWEWNNSTAQGKWGSEFNTYRFTKPTPTSPAIGDTFDYGDTVILTKNKMRGRGHTLAIKFNAEYNKDLKLLGWNTLNTKNGEP